MKRLAVATPVVRTGLRSHPSATGTRKPRAASDCKPSWVRAFQLHLYRLIVQPSRPKPRVPVWYAGLFTAGKTTRGFAKVQKVSEDWQLLDRWIEGDERAGKRLLQQYFGVLSRFFHNKVRNAEDVADLVADTMLGCTKNKLNIRKSKSFRSYLFATAMNQLRGYYRKLNKRGRERDDFLAICTDNYVPQHSMSSLLSKRRESAILVQALRMIPLEYQITLELKLIEGLSGKEIGEMLGVPTPTVHTRLRRGKQQLAAAVEKLATSPELFQSTMTDLDGWAKKLRAQLDAVAAIES